MQSWFSDPSFPNNMSAIWDTYFYFIKKQNIAPLLFGEFGIKESEAADPSSIDYKWFTTFMSYVGKDCSWTFWCMNPNSGDTGGILQDDWVTVNTAKYNLIKPYLAGSGPVITPPPVTPTPVRTATPVRTTTPIRTATPGITATPRVTATPTPVLTTTPVVTPTPVAPTAGIKVQFYNQNTASTSNQIYLNIKLINIDPNSITLSNVKIRYYYTVDGAKPQNFYCDYSTVGSGNITGAFITMATPKTGADTYVEIGFSSAAGILEVGGNVIIQARFAKSDWTNYDQTNDYSMNSTATSYVDWAKITGHISGTLYWGVEP